MKGKRILLLAAASVMLLRLLAPGESERLRGLFLGQAGREAVQAVCLSFSGAEKDEEVVAVFGEELP